MTVHRVSTTDTLAGISARYFGTASRWREIVTANDLRPPYLSSDPIDQFGPLLAAYTLGGPLLAGSVSFVLSDADPAFVRAGAVLWLYQSTPAGESWSDRAVVASFDSAAVTVQSPFAHSYASGIAVQVFPPTANLRGSVAAPGSTLIIPSLVASQLAQFSADDRFGQDLANDQGGRLLISAEGDLVIVGGKDNLIQQLRNRLSCEQRALIRHPDYGCTAAGYIGQANGPTLAVLLQSALALALASDSRVGSVEQVGVTVGEEAIDVSARVLALNEAIDLSLLVG